MRVNVLNKLGESVEDLYLFVTDPDVICVLAGLTVKLLAKLITSYILANFISDLI